jgi:uncharacterized protein (TIGR00369 family)
MHEAQSVTSGPFAGWKTWSHLDPYEARIGPVHYRLSENGQVEVGLDLEAHHMNGLGISHGGLLMSLADQALFAIATEQLGSDNGVTVQLNGEFLGPSRVGQRLIATGQIERGGGSLIFVRGIIRAEGAPVLTFNGIIKRLRRADPASRTDRNR